MERRDKCRDKVGERERDIGIDDDGEGWGHGERDTEMQREISLI